MVGKWGNPRLPDRNTEIMSQIMYDLRGTPTALTQRRDFPLQSINANTLKVRVSLERDEEGWIVASSPDVRGAHSQGKTKEEALWNIVEAVSLVLEETTGQQDPQFVIVLQH